MASSRFNRVRRVLVAPRARRALPLLCRGGTCRPVRVTCTLASIVIAVGCNFTDFSKTQPPPPPPDAGPVTEPACLASIAVMDAGTATAETIAHFTFDNVPDSGQWLDEQQVHTLVPAADSAPGPFIATLTEIPRINGAGQSLQLDGHQFARVAAAGDLFGNSLTVAAWISVPARVFTSDGPASLTWPIISALSDNDNCDGYQLDIRSQRLSTNPTTVQPELVLSYQSQDKGDAGVPGPCMLRSLHAQIDVPSWATGIGRWHHVAGTLAPLGDGTVQAALFWDGKRIQVQDPFEPLPATQISVPSSDRALYVGASALDPTSAAQTKFTGYIDDIAIFNRPLTEQELHEFVLATTTHQGPSNCRWRASEQWDITAFKPSYAKSPVCNNDGCSVIIEDQEWGAGALDARIDPPRDIQLYDKAYLDGNFPEGKAFEFVLASGDNYCTWTYLGHGPKRYVIDLTKPVSCVSTTCEVDFHRVDRASVTSEWAIPSDDRPKATDTTEDLKKKRDDGEEVFVVNRLELELATDPLPNWTGYGGVYGLLGYCWRLQAYEPETAAAWTQGTAVWSDSMSARLSGPMYSGTRVMADFGERGLDIKDCSGATVDATLQSAGGSSTKYTLAAQDVNGSWLGFDLSLDANTGAYNADFAIPSSASAKDENFSLFLNHAIMDPHRVRLLGLQKPWAYDGVPLNVTIRGLQFSPQGCEHPGPG